MSLKLGKRFHNCSLGGFYFDPETYEVTIRLEYPDGRVFHEHREKALSLIGNFAIAIDKIQKILSSEGQAT